MLTRTVILVMTIVALCSVAWAQEDGRATTHIFPQFVDGKLLDGTYYRSTLMLSNPSSTSAGTCSFAVYAGGNLLFTVPYNIPGSAWNSDGTLGTSPFFSGYGKLTCTLLTNANLLYSLYAADGKKLSEATVFSSLPGRLLQVIGDQREGARLGIAITNDSSAEQIVTIAVGSETGMVVASRGFTVAGRSNLVGFMDELVGWTGQLGQVLIQCPSLCSAIGLRFTGATFTTIPSTVRQP